MDPACLDHCLTAAEHREFEENGYLVLDNILPFSTVDALIEATDRIDAQNRQERGMDAHERMSVRDILWRHDLLLNLVDYPTILPKVWGILGWNIQIYHSVIVYTPPSAPDETEVRLQGWHQDSDQLNRDLEFSPRPRISIKVAFFLSDCTQPGRANFWAIPGTHLMDEYDIPTDGSLPQGAQPILCPAGGAIIFDRRLWHTASSNTSDITRKILLYGYSYRWLRPRDDQAVEHLYQRCDPIRRQLLGDAPTGGFGYTSPTDEDVPLRGWLQEHLDPTATP